MMQLTVLLVALLAAARADPFIGYNYDVPQCPFVPPETVVVPTTITDYRVQTVTQWEQPQARYQTQYSTIVVTETFNQQVPVYQTVTQTVQIPSPPPPPVIEYQTVTYPPIVSTYISTLVQPTPVYQTVTDYETVTVPGAPVTLPPQVIYSTVQAPPQIIYSTVQLPPQYVTITPAPVGRCGGSFTSSPDRQYLPPTGNGGFDPFNGFVQKFKKFL